MLKKFVTAVMLGFIAAMLIAGTIGVAGSRAQDSWTGPDKKLHFVGSYVFGVATSQFTDDKPKAFALAMVPGVLKELGDAGSPGNKFSAKDLAADALGAWLGVTTGHWLVRRREGALQIAYVTSF